MKRGKTWAWIAEEHVRQSWGVQSTEWRQQALEQSCCPRPQADPLQISHLSFLSEFQSRSKKNICSVKCGFGGSWRFLLFAQRIWFTYLLPYNDSIIKTTVSLLGDPYLIMAYPVHRNCAREKRYSGTPFYSHQPHMMIHGHTASSHLRGGPAHPLGSLPPWPCPHTYVFFSEIYTVTSLSNCH